MVKEKEKDPARASEWYDATLLDEKPSRLSRVIVFLLCTTMVFGVVAYGAVESWALGFLSVFIGAVVILWLCDSLFSGSFRYHTSVLQLPVIGLILIGLVQLLPLRSRDIPVDLLSQPVSASITYSAYSTSYAVLTLCLYLLFFAAALNYVSDQKRYKKMVVFIIVFASIMAFLGIIQKLTNTNSIYWLRPSPGIPFASYVNQHHFASLMVMTSSLVFGLLLGDGTGKDKRLLLGIALALMGLAIIFTGSRGGLLSYIGSMGFVWLVVFFGRRRGSREGDPESDSKLLGRKIGMVGAAVALGAVLLGGVMFLGAESSFIRGIGLSDQADVTTGRAHFWKTALLMIKDHPIMGVGLDAFGAAFPKYDTWNGNFRLEQAHNDYIQILTDAGILGFACAAAFIYFFFRRGFGIFFKTTDRFRRGAVLGALGGCLGIFIHSLFDFPLRTTGNTFFFLMLVVIAVGTLNYPKLYKPQRSTN